MKVLHLGMNVNGGAGLGMLRLHRDLLARGVDSRILCGRYGGDDPRVSTIPPAVRRLGSRRNLCAAALRKLGLHESEYYRAQRLRDGLDREHHRTVSTPFSLYPLEECPGVQEADVVHLHWVSGLVNLPTFLRRAGRPIVWTIRDENPLLGFYHYRCDEPASLAREERDGDIRLRKVKLESVRACPSIAFVSLSSEMDALLAAHPISENRRRAIIPNSIDGTLFAPGDGDAVRQELGIAPDAKVIAFVAQGLGDPRKGLVDLFAAASRLRREDIVILCVGSGQPPPVPVNLRIVNLGKIVDTTRLSAIFSAADLFVSPSLAETFGKTTTEALACGTPVLSYPNCGARDVVGPEDGMLADDFTAEALEAGLREILQRRFDRAAIRRRVLDRFSPSYVADAYLRLYRDVLEEARGFSAKRADEDGRPR